LLAALYVANIDNAVIEINNEEVPIMDGSAKEFLETLNKTKIKTFSKKRKYLKILEKIEFSDGEKKISIEPSKSLEVDFQLNYQNKIIGKQRNIINFNDDNLDEVSNSRTFCLFEDVEKIKKLGLAKGGSLDNAIVVDQNKILNNGGLRNRKEFVNHKILDLAGDFLLSGYRVLGKVKCYQGGHEFTNLFLRELLEKNRKKFAIIELEDKKIAQITNNNYLRLAATA
jgi:UDP-3-O-[3-hydroxymyristoyl] N-acetylglucosamine deacetylase